MTRDESKASEERANPKRCDTCKHWSPNTTGMDGSCLRLKAINDHPTVGDNPGVTFDGDYFECSYDFGCVLHMDREQ